MTAPTFSFTVTGATHDDVMAEAYGIASDYWGGRHYDIVDVEAFRYSDGLLTANVTTRLHGVAS